MSGDSWLSIILLLFPTLLAIYTVYREKPDEKSASTAWKRYPKPILYSVTLIAFGFGVFQVVLKDKEDKAKDKMHAEEKLEGDRKNDKLQTSLSVVSKSSTQGARNRGVKAAPFVVLIGAEMPSVLAEIGFLTNSSEEALLRKPEHRQKIAEALYKGIAAYADTLSRVSVARSN